MCDAWITCGVNPTIWNLNVVKEKVNFCPGFENSDEGVTIKQKKNYSKLRISNSFIDFNDKIRFNNR